MSAESITIHRRDTSGDPDVPPEVLPGAAGATTNPAQGVYHVYIFDNAYFANVNGTRDDEPSRENFRGTIAHELAHIAIRQRPDLLESWAKARGWPWPFSNLQYPGTLTGANFAIEHIAMAAAAWEVNPQLMVSHLFFVLEVSWEYEWASSFAGRIPCYVP